MPAARGIEYVLDKLRWMRAEHIWPNGLRYLWTDAFGVVLLASLYRALAKDDFLDEAEWVAAEVNRVLGRPRGIRIGEEPDRDGQYFHYLAMWLYALAVIGRVSFDQIAPQQISSLFDHLVGAGEAHGGSSERKQIGGDPIRRQPGLVQVQPAQAVRRAIIEFEQSARQSSIVRRRGLEGVLLPLLITRDHKPGCGHPAFAHFTDLNLEIGIAAPGRAHSGP